MKSRGRTWSFVLIILCALPCGAARAAETADQKAVRTRRMAFTRALGSRDPARVLTFVSPSFTLRTANGQTLKLEQAREQISQVANLIPEGVRINTRIHKLNVSGIIASLSVTDTLNYTDTNGQAQKFSSSRSETWKKTKGKWMLIKSQEI